MSILFRGTLYENEGELEEAIQKEGKHRLAEVKFWEQGHRVIYQWNISTVNAKSL